MKCWTRKESMGAYKKFGARKEVLGAFMKCWARTGSVERVQEVLSAYRKC